MSDRFTEQARRALYFARHEAGQAASPLAEPEHVLLGTDYPFDMADETPVESIEGLGLGSDTIRLVMEENARRLFRLQLGKTGA